MTDAPDVDGRRAAEIREHVEEIAPYYAPQWDLEEGGVGAGLVELFAEMAAGVTERLDAAPSKHRIAFFEALGFNARPPEPAQVPIQLRLDENAPRNVAVRPGTEAVAESDEEISFRVGEEDAFEATPARLTHVLAVDPAADAIYDHADVVDGGMGVLFDGENVQEHSCYFGDEMLLTAGAGTTVTVLLETDADPAVVRNLIWEYFGEAPADGGDAEDCGEMTEGWHEFGEPTPSENVPDGFVGVDVSPDGPFTEREVAGVESKWLRMRLPPALSPDGPRSFRVHAVRLGPMPEPRYFDSLLANDVPLATGPEEETEADDGDEESGEPPGIAPFGETPRRGDAFYLASEDAFTKAGSRATIAFERPGESLTKAGSASQVAAETRVSDPIAEGASNEDDGEYEFDGERVEEDETSEGGENGEDEVGGEDGAGDETKATGVPVVSWEYWNGDGWTRIRGLRDGTTGFTDGGDVTFEIPDDLEPTSAAGHEGYWIRARLVGGDFGDVVYVEEEEGRWSRVVTDAPPRYGAVTVRYRFAAAEAPNHVLAHNALTDERVDPEAENSFRPFRPLTDETQTLYFGFDRRIAGGPIQLFLDVADQLFPLWFAPRVRWERATKADGETWAGVSATDETAGLTGRGIIGLSLAEPPAAAERFGTERHWLRARVRGTPFGIGEDDGIEAERSGETFAQPTDIIGRTAGIGGGTRRIDGHSGERLNVDRRPRQISDVDRSALRESVAATVSAERSRGVDEPSDDGWGTGPDPGVQPCGVTVETTPSAGEPTAESPTLRGIYPNTGRARNVEAVDGEVLGGSDGGPDTSFSVAETPVLEPAVWVDELSALSTAQRDALRGERPDDVIEETSSGGSLRAFWVRWERVESFIDAAGDDRCYVLDPTDGVVGFGDGTRGKIPPRGTDNVRIDYATGGGDAGNVAAGAIEELKSGLPFVEEVTNPVPAAGGAPAEATEDVLERAPRTLRDRGRAVAAADYERIARDASRLIARARCLPGMNEAGESAPGWVTVLVVPDDGSSMPEPSTGLLENVKSELAEHAPAALVARGRLVVRGPSYVSIGVDADIVADGETRLGAVEERVESVLETFLHPLSGGENGDGWRFGALPGRSDVFALLEGVGGVDHVASLSLSFNDAETVTSADGGGPPTTSPDALVRGADHDLLIAHEGEAGGGD